MKRAIVLGLAGLLFWAGCGGSSSSDPNLGSYCDRACEVAARCGDFPTDEIAVCSDACVVAAGGDASAELPPGVWKCARPCLSGCDVEACLAGCP